MTKTSAELFSKISEMVPNGLNIPMYESWCIRINIFHITIFSGKHGNLDEFPQNLFKTFENGSKLFHMVPNSRQMKWKILRNLIELVGHNLEKTEFLTELSGTCSNCVQLNQNS